MPGPEPPLPPWLRAWDWVRALGRVLWLVRFSVVFVAIGMVALLANDQAQEVLREFAARRSTLRDLVQMAILLLATLLWCVNGWAWARMLTSLRMPGAREPEGAELALRVAVPRTLGAVAAFAVPAAMWIAADAYVEYATPFAQQMRWIAAAMFVGAVVFVAFIVFRRRVPMMRIRRPAADAARGHLEWTSLPAFDRATLWITGGVTVTLFVLFAIDAATTAPWFGSAPILLAALAAWIPFGSMLVWLSHRWHGVPLFTLFLLAAVVFGLWNDNHAVRTLEGTVVASARPDDCNAVNGTPGAPAAKSVPRYPVCGHAKRWLNARRDEITAYVARTGQPYPVYLVAASGGGIRSAYWTAGLLGFRHDLDPDFARRTFAISSVSGGSLGVIVYAGLVRARAAHPAFAGCGGRYGNQPVADCATQILAGDFLAPTLAALLYPDLVARFLPFAVPHVDRARAMERGWEKRWDDVMGARGGEWMAASFEALADPDPASAVPLVLLNTTTVEEGRRALISPLAVLPREFPDTVDLRAAIGHPLSNSTAAHLSARFMYVSPAGTVKTPSGDVAGHIVDGGYFENSGTTTLTDALFALLTAAHETGLEKNIRPVAIVMENDPYAEAPAEVDPPVLNPARALPWLVETRAGPVTLLNTRDARGTQAQAALRRAILSRGDGLPPGRFEYYRPANAVDEIRGDPAVAATEAPQAQRIPLPLGWMLSDLARSVLDQQVVRQTCLRNPALCDSPR